MKNHFTLIVIIGLLLCNKDIKAQAETEDVIRLKNGYIYRGTIIEKGNSFKIKISSGYIASIDSTSIDSIIRAPKLSLHDIEQQNNDAYFTYKNKGVFFQSDLLLGYLDFGIGITAGYKFHQFAHFGVGTAIEFAEPFNDKNPSLGQGYAPVYLQYGGDILKKEFTPIYWLQFGYAWAVRPNVNFLTSESTDHGHYAGGYTGGIGFGAKYYSPYSRFVCSWTVGYNILHASSHEWGSFQGRRGGPPSSYDRNTTGYLNSITTGVSFGF